MYDFQDLDFRTASQHAVEDEVGIGRSHKLPNAASSQDDPLVGKLRKAVSQILDAIDNPCRCSRIILGDIGENGVEFGFSYYGGYRKFADWDPYDVRRRWLSRSVTRDRFALMLTLPQVFTWR